MPRVLTVVLLCSKFVYRDDWLATAEEVIMHRAG
jgi:hypothetical protein